MKLMIYHNILIYLKNNKIKLSLVKKPKLKMKVKCIKLVIITKQSHYS